MIYRISYILLYFRHYMTDAVKAYEVKARDQWLFDYPAQVSLCGTQIWWTSEVRNLQNKLKMEVSSNHKLRNILTKLSHHYFRWERPSGNWKKVTKMPSRITTKNRSPNWTIWLLYFWAPWPKGIDKRWWRFVQSMSIQETLLGNWSRTRLRAT